GLPLRAARVLQDDDRPFGRRAQVLRERRGRGRPDVLRGADHEDAGVAEQRRTEQLVQFGAFELAGGDLGLDDARVGPAPGGGDRADGPVDEQFLVPDEQDERRHRFWKVVEADRARRHAVILASGTDGGRTRPAASTATGAGPGAPEPAGPAW